MTPQQDKQQLASLARIEALLTAILMDIRKGFKQRKIKQ